jgi:tetrapyrrole methylase family protein/MazG family protein
MPDPLKPDQGELDRLIDIVAQLRGEHGCPWDKEQTLETLKPHLIEESYELLDAIDSGDPDRHKDELGDVLLQVVLQAQIRSEEGEFLLEDVARGLSEKLIRRHPHVFGDVEVSDSAEVLRNWEAIKAEERNDPDRSMLEGLPSGLPALHRAQRVQARASRVGFDWSNAADVLSKVEEEIREIREALAAEESIRTSEEIGDLLFSIVNFSRFNGIHAEEALRQAVDRFVNRFSEVERRMTADGRSLEASSLEEMDRYWNVVKADEA